MLDTGPIVGWLRSDDADHHACVDAITRSARSGRLLITTWEVIGEAYTLIRYRFAANPAAARTVLRWARTATIMTSERVDHSRAEEILLKHGEMRLSYVDALLLAVAERHRLDELITLDGEMSAVKLTTPLSVIVL